MKIKTVLFVNGIKEKTIEHLNKGCFHKIAQFSTANINGFDKVHYKEIDIIESDFNVLTLYHDNKHMYGALQDFDNNKINYCYVNLNGLRYIYNKFNNNIKSLKRDNINNIDFLIVGFNEDDIQQKAINRYSDIVIDKSLDLDNKIVKTFLDSEWVSFKNFFK